MGKAAAWDSQGFCRMSLGQKQESLSFCRREIKKAFLSSLLPIEKLGCELVSIKLLLARSCGDDALKVDSSKTARVFFENVSPSAYLGT